MACARARCWLSAHSPAASKQGRSALFLPHPTPRKAAGRLDGRGCRRRRAGETPVPQFFESQRPFDYSISTLQILKSCEFPALSSRQSCHPIFMIAVQGTKSTSYKLHTKIFLWPAGTSTFPWPEYAASHRQGPFHIPLFNFSGCYFVHRFAPIDRLAIQASEYASENSE